MPDILFARRKLYHRIREYPDYECGDAIVTYSRMPYEQMTTDDQFKQIYISKYQYKIKIDLYLFRIRIGFIGRQRKAPHSASIMGGIK